MDFMLLGVFHGFGSNGSLVDNHGSGNACLYFVILKQVYWNQQG